MSKRNILISAKTQEEFKEIEDTLDLLADSFIKKFDAVRGSSFSGGGSSLFFTNNNAMGEGALVFPDLAENITLKLEKDVEPEGVTINNSKMYGALCSFSLEINEKKYYFSTEVKSYSEIKKIESMNIIKTK